MTKATDDIRAANTIETPEIKASRGERFHVVATGDGGGFIFGFPTVAGALSRANAYMGSGVDIYDTDTGQRHSKAWNQGFRWMPPLPADDSEGAK